VLCFIYKSEQTIYFDVRIILISKYNLLCKTTQQCLQLILQLQLLKHLQQMLQQLTQQLLLHLMQHLLLQQKVETQLQLFSFLSKLKDPEFIWVFVLLKKGLIMI
jgi:hypothetical protein